MTKETVRWTSPNHYRRSVVDDDGSIRFYTGFSYMFGTSDPIEVKSSDEIALEAFEEALKEWRAS